MKNKSSKKILSWKEAYGLNKRAVRLIYENYPKMMISRVINVIWNAITPYVPIYLSALIVSELAGERNPERLKELIFITLISELILSLVGVFLAKWRNYENSGGFFKAERILTKKLLEMDFADVDDSKVHELLYRIRQSQTGGGWGIWRTIDGYESILSSVFTILGGIVMTISLFTKMVPASSGKYVILNSPLFILAVIAVMFTITYIAPILSNKADSYWAVNADEHAAGNRLFGYVGSFMKHKGDLAADVRIYRQDFITNKYKGYKTGTFASKGIFAKLSKGPIGLYHTASAVVSLIFTGFVYMFVCLKARAGAFGIGEVTQYIASVTRVSGGVSSLIRSVGDMRNNASFLKEIFRFLDIPNKMYQGSLTVEKRSDRDYEIEFKNVCFSYPGSDTYALENINMKFRIGRRLAAVGMNGSGKTTFIKLLCRLYDPTKGEILLNGINIRKYNYLEYMSIFSIVFQDFRLFAFPLGQNVAARAGYDKKRAEECLQKSGFGERLESMSDGLETYLYRDLSDKGIDISGGEAQKIALARTLYRDAPFMVLDEPTAALDPIAEAEIYGKFNEIAGDKTTVYISHRLSSCKFCDDIVVFNEGKIVQQGSHEELVLDESGKYYELWHAQAQYYT